MSESTQNPYMAREFSKLERELFLKYGTIFPNLDPTNPEHDRIMKQYVPLEYPERKEFLITWQRVIDKVELTISQQKEIANILLTENYGINGPHCKVLAKNPFKLLCVIFWFWKREGEVTLLLEAETTMKRAHKCYNDSGGWIEPWKDKSNIPKDGIKLTLPEFKYLLKYEDTITNFFHKKKTNQDDNIEASIHIMLEHYDWFQLIKHHLTSKTMGPIKLIGTPLTITITPNNVKLSTYTQSEYISIDNRDSLRKSLERKILTNRSIMKYKEAMILCGVDNCNNLSSRRNHSLS